MDVVVVVIAAIDYFVALLTTLALSIVLVGGKPFHAAANAETAGTSSSSSWTCPRCSFIKAEQVDSCLFHAASYRRIIILNAMIVLLLV
jgi:hypothetical protein